MQTSITLNELIKLCKDNGVSLDTPVVVSDIDEWTKPLLYEFDIDVRKKYKVNIIAVKKGNSLQSLPGADYRFDFDDHIVVIGASADVFKLTSKT